MATIDRLDLPVDEAVRPRVWIGKSLSARDYLCALADRRIDNDHMSNPDRGRAGLQSARLELHIIESQLRVRGLLE